MTASEELPDLDWYLDNVLVHAQPVHAQPGVFEAPPVGAAVEWTKWWQARAADLRRRGDPAADLALKQGFVVGTGQLATLGWEPHVLRREVRRATWSSVARGVASPIVLPSVADDDPDRFDVRRRGHAPGAAAAALSRREQVISGRSAAVLRGLPILVLPATPEVTSRTPAALGRRKQAQVHGARLLAVDEAAWFGAPCTTVARTVVDLARHDRREGLMAADAALHSRVLDRQGLDAVFERCAGWPGIRQARSVLALAIDEAESPLESLLRLALHDSGFPPPEPQVVIADPARHRSYRVDLCWPAVRLIVEADGRVQYRGDELARAGAGGPAARTRLPRRARHVARRHAVLAGNPRPPVARAAPHLPGLNRQVSARSLTRRDGKAPAGRHDRFLACCTGRSSSRWLPRCARCTGRW